MTRKRRIVTAMLTALLVAGFDVGGTAALALHGNINEWPWQVGP